MCARILRENKEFILLDRVKLSDVQRGLRSPPEMNFVRDFNMNPSKIRMYHQQEENHVTGKAEAPISYRS